MKSNNNSQIIPKRKFFAMVLSFNEKWTEWIVSTDTFDTSDVLRKEEVEKIEPVVVARLGGSRMALDPLAGFEKY
jgi:hypothetical protein